MIDDQRKMKTVQPPQILTRRPNYLPPSPKGRGKSLAQTYCTYILQSRPSVPIVDVISLKTRPLINATYNITITR